MTSTQKTDEKTLIEEFKQAVNMTASELESYKVIGYIYRHLAQRPLGEIESSRWRYSLMNWGHDPLKEG